jgi:hypothetical protein
MVKAVEKEAVVAVIATNKKKITNKLKKHIICIFLRFIIYKNNMSFR